MRVDQAIFTSLKRDGKSGYHVIARSLGVTERESNAIATWSPSNGALITDERNRISVNYHPLPGGRYALSRTCEGPLEFSGRGGKQLYTHVLLVDSLALRDVAAGPIAIYRDALALGRILFQRDPPNRLEQLELGSAFPGREPDHWIDRARVLGLPSIAPIVDRVLSQDTVRIVYSGDRLFLAECVLGTLPVDVRFTTSFSTGLKPSSVRPCRLALVGLDHSN
ncbi:MAG: hypothetical protein NVSMB14_08010 [Isosphaeraceae bacterium]